MLDLFTIFSKGGIVLWYFQGTSQLLTNSVNELIKSVILQERGLTSAWNHNTLSLQYKLDNEFELVFVVAYQNILKLTYIDKFLTEIQLRFRDKYKQKIQNGQFNHDFNDFRSDFDSILRECETEARQSAKQAAKPRGYHESEKSTRTVASMIENKKGFLSNFVSSSSDTNTTSANTKPNSTSIKEMKDEGIGESAGESNSNDNSNSNLNDLADSNFDDSIQKKSLISGKPMRRFEKPVKAKSPNPSSPQNKKTKSNRKWVEGDDYETLDFSNDRTGANGLLNPTEENKENVDKYGSKDIVGKSSGALKSIEVEDISYDYDDNDNDDNEQVSMKKKASANKSNNKLNGLANGADKKKSQSSLFSSFKSLVGSKVLTKESMEPVMEKMQEHLVSKNVAADIAAKVCENVAQNLEGKQLGSFQFVATTIKQALHESMVQILTPKKRIDILRDAFESQRLKKPYVIVFCGVNGVGKTTNLAKVTFWLIENKFRVLIAACDTFRSGAVEQLRTHTRHLNALHPPENHDGKQMVELFEKGYGKDSASVAHDAISHAKYSKIDVVLVDTAGRMQDNEPLMIELAKLININNPDLVLFVGEALVGNEAVDQVKKFNQSLIDHSSVKGNNMDQARTIDGIVLTKFDTIDDKVGAAISMTYTTGQPIVFVGTGQTYSDLKSLNAQSVVHSLLK